MENSRRPLRLLSLDGGGVRGLSSIMILKHIIRGINSERQKDGAPNLEPWQVFDMIGGTSTGGIIAIMLGRLRMSLDECEEAYITLSKDIFTARTRSSYIPVKKVLTANGKFDAKAMERTIKEQIRRKGFPEDILLRDERTDCRVFAVSVRVNNTEPALFRSYPNPQASEGLLNECRVWEACRATSAATTFFDPIAIGTKGQEFLDGGLLYNNPVRLVQQEADIIWPGRDSLLVSIGTGEPPSTAFTGGMLNIIRRIADLATETKKTANDFYQSNLALVEAERYFRFNVTHGLAEVQLEEYTQTAKIADMTESYIDTGEVNRKFRICVRRLLQTEHEGSLRDPLDGRLTKMSDVDRLAIIQWFSPLSFAQTQKDLLAKQQEGTGSWLLESPKFQEWKARPQQELWCHGIPGAGKSTMVSMLVNHLQLEREQAGGRRSIGVSWIYCSFNPNVEPDSAKDLIAALWRGLAAQRARVSPSVEAAYDTNQALGSGSRPDFNMITDELNAEIKSHDEVYLFMDGVDECPESERFRVVEQLQSFSHDHRNVHVLFTTRSHLYSLFDVKDNLEIRPTEPDLVLFLTGRMSAYSPKFQRMVDTQHVDEQGPTETLRQHIIRTIIDRAAGMFLLARLHLESLRWEVTIQGLKARLAEVPKGDVNKTYDLAMDRIEGQTLPRKETALQVLSWIIFAQIPLTVPEVLHALAVSPEDEEINQERLLFSEDSLLEYCAGLVTIEQASRIIRLVHPTTVEYFDSLRGDTSRSERDIRFPHAQREMATKCLTYLLFSEFSIGPCLSVQTMALRIRDYPLLPYAARHWGTHARSEESCQTIMKLVLDLFSEHENLESTVQGMYITSGPNELPRYPKEMTGLMIAAYFGLNKIANILLARGADPNALNSDTELPLQLAVRNGHVAIVQRLLQCDLEMSNPVDHMGSTLLHVACYRGYVEVVRLLLQRVGALDMTSLIGRSALMEASAGGHDAVVKLLLTHGASPHVMDRRCRTALSLASSGRHHSVVQQLLLQLIGRSLPAEQWLEFHLALEDNLQRSARRGRREDVRDVQSLLHHTSTVSLKCPRGQSHGVPMVLAVSDIAFQQGLGYAAEEGQLPLVKAYVQHRVFIDSTNREGKSPLHCAALNGHARVVEFLLRNGADVALRDGRYRKTPLDIAIDRGHSGVKDLLIEYVAGSEYGIFVPNAATSQSTVLGEYSQTTDAARQPSNLSTDFTEIHAITQKYFQLWRLPIHWAAYLGYNDAAKYFVDIGYDCNAADYNVETPLHLACAGRGLDTVRPILQAESRLTLETVRDYGTNYCTHITALHGTVSRENYDSVDLLLAHGADIEARNAWSCRPLHVAARHANHRTACLLLSRNAEVDSRDYANQTPLHHAVDAGSYDVCALLLERGADRNAHGHRGTPLDMAVWLGHNRIAHLLRGEAAAIA